MKYNTGDKVRVRRDLKLRKSEPGYPGVIQDMVDMGGKILTIKNILSFWDGTYEVEENCYQWTEDMIETTDSGILPSFSKIVESVGIKKGDRVQINGHELIFTGESFVDKSGKRTNTKIFGSEFKILPKPRTGAEILRYLKGIRGGWIPDWEDEDEEKYHITYRHNSSEWAVNVSWNYEIPGVLFFTKEAIEEVRSYLNTLTEGESMNLLEEMRV